MTESSPTVSLVRRVSGDPELLWEAWTNADQLRRWWWPQRFQTLYEIDLRQGGRYRFVTEEIPDVGRLDLRGRFLEVIPPSRLVYTWKWESKGDHESTVTVEFAQTEARVELHLKHEGLLTAADRDNHVVGWNDCLDRLTTLMNSHTQSP